MFFLRLYGNNIRQAKYAHDEFSKLELRLIAMQVALLKDDNETLSKILTEFSIIKEKIEIEPKMPCYQENERGNLEIQDFLGQIRKAFSNN